MSDYKRFVSYLYEYKNNIKSKNCGFCRVELRDHTCRLEIHLKLPVYPFTPTLKVYAFVPSNEKLYGIFLGNASYQQGNVSGTFSFPEHNIKNSSYQFSQLGGIFIQTDSGFYFASAWKDLNIYPERFVLHENKSAQTKSFEKECSPELSLPNSNSEIPPAQPEIEPGQPPTETSPSISIETKILPKSNSEITSSQKSEITIDQKDTTENICKETEDTQNQLKEETPALLAASAEKETTPDNFWEIILNSYPQCHPFFDDEIHNCVQLSQKDVQTISASGYPICNNAFFRHNCQSFQHFLIGKKDYTMAPLNTSKSHYVLAVPGIYNPKEQYMATMFGFPYFKCSQNTQYRNNCWGYWYRIIPEHWEDCRH